MKFTFKVFLLVISLIIFISFPSHAHEWSDEVRMTHGNENSIGPEGLYVEIDSHDDIHTLYTYIGYQNEEFSSTQAVYQKFTCRGEPITDPIVLCEFAYWRDGWPIYGYDMFIDNNENIYLLWGVNYWINASILSIDGEVIESKIEFSEISAVYDRSSHPRLVVDSHGNIIIMTLARNQINEDSSIVNTSLYKYDNEWNFVDTLYTMPYGMGIPNRFYLEIEENNTLHASWYENSDYRYAYYTKISSDGDVIVDGYTLPGVVNERGLFPESFAIHTDGCPLFTANDYLENGIDLYAIKIDLNLNVEFRTYLGNAHYGSNLGSICISDLGDIHLINDYYYEREGANAFLGYQILDAEGIIIDSLNVVHNRDMREGNRPADWSQPKLFITSDDLVGVVWLDDRHLDRPNNYLELYMRYYNPDNSVNYNNEDNHLKAFTILPNYPNPFNSSVLITYSLPEHSDVRLAVFDLSGREVSVLQEGMIEAGNHSAIWKADNLPSGIYWCRLEAEKNIATMKLTLIK